MTEKINVVGKAMNAPSKTNIFDNLSKISLSNIVSSNMKKREKDIISIPITITKNKIVAKISIFIPPPDRCNVQGSNNVINSAVPAHVTELVDLIEELPLVQRAEAVLYLNDLKNKK